MSENDQLGTKRFIAASAGIFLSLTLLLLAATDLQAAPASEQEYLPEKAKTVAAKFEIFKKSARPGEIERKRKQVIEYLGSLLKQEASNANLEGALAVRSLIATIRSEGTAEAKPATKTTAKGRQGAPPSTASRSTSKSSPGVEGLALTRFSLGKTRRFEYPFSVRKDARAATIRCEFTRASDDSGDRGLHYELIDPNGLVAKKGFLQSWDTELVTLRTKTSGGWKVAVIDNDTSLDGSHPGNSGTLRVRVMRDGTALASRGR